VPSLSRSEMLRLARAGAEARVNQLREELESLYRSFPDLRRGRRPAANGAARAGRRTSSSGASAGGGRKTRGWTAAQRRAVAERMKRYWAARRAKK